jgi:hypothetical protein
MRLLVWPLALVFALAASTAVGQAPPAGPHVLITIAFVEDDVCGTSCPVIDGERVVRLAPDGSFEEIGGPALVYGPGAQPWGVHVGSTAVHVGWRTGDSMDIPLRHFGRSPRLIWSPSGRRFAVLETWGDDTVDRLLVVDPEQRRSRLLPLTARAHEFHSAAFLADDRSIAQTIDSHDYLRLTRFDAVTGRVVSSRYSLLPVAMGMDWSSAAQRLAIEDQNGHVSVVSLVHPNRARRLKLTGEPRWSADGTRILVVPPNDGPVPNDPGAVELAAWPGGTRVPVSQVFDAQWLPGGTSLVGLQGSTDPYGGKVPRVVQVGLDGRVTRVIPVQWPASSGGYFPTMIPVAIEGTDPS